jgi:hypothetical protein
MPTKQECDRDELEALLFENARKSGKCDDLASVVVSGPFDDRDVNWSIAGRRSKSGIEIVPGECSAALNKIVAELGQKYESRRGTNAFPPAR